METSPTPGRCEIFSDVKGVYTADPRIVYDARKLAQALHATAVWANRNHDKTADLAARTLKIEPDVVRSMRRAVFAETVTPRLITPVIEAGVTYGEFQVSIEPEGFSSVTSKVKRPNPNFPAKYLDPAASGLTAKITPETTQLPTIELK